MLIGSRLKKHSENLTQEPHMLNKKLPYQECKSANTKVKENKILKL